MVLVPPLLHVYSPLTYSLCLVPLQTHCEIPSRVLLQHPPVACSVHILLLRAPSPLFLQVHRIYQTWMFIDSIAEILRYKYGMIVLGSTSHHNGEGTPHNTGVYRPLTRCWRSDARPVPVLLYASPNIWTTLNSGGQADQLVAARSRRVTV